MVCFREPENQCPQHGLGHAALVRVWLLGKAQLVSRGRITSTKCPPALKFPVCLASSAVSADTLPVSVLGSLKSGITVTGEAGAGLADDWMRDDVM